MNSQMKTPVSTVEEVVALSSTSRTARAVKDACVGMPKPLTDLLVRLNASERQEMRVKATMDAAMVGLEDKMNPEVEAGFRLLLDMSGVGGTLGTGIGGRSARNALFSKLGKGRWRASDGSAYMKASMEALYKFCTEPGPFTLGIRVEGDLDPNGPFGANDIEVHSPQLDGYLNTFDFERGGTMFGFREEMKALCRRGIMDCVKPITEIGCEWDILVNDVEDALLWGVFLEGIERIEKEEMEEI